MDSNMKYLGEPALWGRSKKMVPYFLCDRVRNRFKSWKQSLLSVAGKEILIKAVIQAIPSFIMSSISIPSSVQNKFSTLIRKFWWGSYEEVSKIHWKDWGTVSLLKELVVLVFRISKLSTWRSQPNKDGIPSLIRIAHFSRQKQALVLLEHGLACWKEEILLSKVLDGRLAAVKALMFVLIVGSQIFPTSESSLLNLLFPLSPKLQI